MSLKRRNDLACPFPKFSLALVVCLAIHCARSQPADTLEKDSKVNPRKIPLEASLTNGSVIFSWPVQTKPTEFQAQEAGSDEWKAVPESSFHTNKSVVSVTLPVGEKPCFTGSSIRLLPIGQSRRPVWPVCPCPRR